MNWPARERCYQTLSTTSNASFTKRMPRSRNISKRNGKMNGKNVFTEKNTSCYSHWSNREPKQDIKLDEACRLRLGMCGLIAHLNKIGVHETGLCDKCRNPETIKHYQLEYENEMSQIVRDMCNKHNVAETLHIKRYNPWIKTKIIARYHRQIHGRNT